MTFRVLTSRSVDEQRENLILTASVGAFSGPFTGTIAGNFRKNCWGHSFRLLPYCALLLATGFVSQIIPLPFQPFKRTFRLSMWGMGMLGWFGGVPASLIFVLL